MIELTVPEAARRMHVSERKVRQWIASGDLRVVGKGWYGARTVAESDVEALMDRLRLGDLEERKRTILVVQDASLELQVAASRASGLRVIERPTVIDAFESHDTTGMPILVAHDGLPPTELRLLGMAAMHSYVLVVGADVLGAAAHTRVDHGDVRLFVTTAWQLVSRRIEQLALKL